MSVQTFEGLVENGRIRLLEDAVLPDKTRVYVVVPGAEPRAARLWSPRLADPAQASDFRMQVTTPGDPDAEL